MRKDWAIVVGIILIIFLGIFGVIIYQNWQYSLAVNNSNQSQPSSTPVIEKVYAPTAPNNQKLLESCLANAKADYENQVQIHTVCETGVGCMVSYLVQPILDQKLKNDQDICFKEFPN